MAKEKKASINLEPLDDRVVVQRLEAEEKTAGGIVLPDAAKEKPMKARIIAAGPGKQLDSGERAPMGVAVGDLVLIGKYAGTEVKVSGEEYLIMRESDILAKLSE
jgi:chaperonin GroES